MDIEKLTDLIRNLVIGEIKEEFKEFKASVTGELSGYRFAIESMNERMKILETRQFDLEKDLKEFKKEINDKLDQQQLEFKTEIKNLKSELRQEIYNVKTELKQDIAKVDQKVESVKTELEQKINNVDNKIDTAKRELKQDIGNLEDKINLFNMRLDIFTKYVMDLGTELSKLRSDVNVALSQKEVINDILLRVERIESKI